jgi:hypothetical protein
MASVAFYLRYAECHYAECRHAECRFAECRSAVSMWQLLIMARTK